MIDLSREGDVFVLRMRHGENRLGLSFLQRLSECLDEVEESTGDAALVTIGDGKFYSNGLDLQELRSSSPRQVEDTLDSLHRLFARVLAFPVATVAALNGHAFAAGGMLAIAHDFRIMRRDRGYFCLPEIDLATGQPLTPGMFALLSARLSVATLHETLVTGKRYGGAEALAARIVDETAAEEDILPRAIARASGLAAKHRPTLAALKAGLFESPLRVLRGAQRLEPSQP